MKHRFHDPELARLAAIAEDTGAEMKAPATAPANQQAQAPAPGQFFGVPGLTQWTEQKENNDGLVINLGQSAPANVQGIIPFKQVDVVFWWELEVTWSNTVTAGTQTINTSPYFPYNIFGESRVKIQNQFDSWHVYTGIDAAIFQLIRPMRPGTDSRENLGANPAGAWSSNGGWANANTPQPNLDATAGATSSSGTINFSLEIPASLRFDAYWELAEDGTVLDVPKPAWVSPQFMAGTARMVAPAIAAPAILGSALDTSPYVATGSNSTPATASGTITLGFRRVGLYSSNNQAAMPVVRNWQYLRDVSQFSLSGVNKKDLVVPTVGQILSLFVRLWDPSANSGIGGAIALSNVTRCSVQYGSGLLRFDDTPRSMQRRFLRQHGVLLPAGVMAWDLAVDELGKISNARALNTLNTASVLVHLDFSGALSSTAYAVMGVEALTYVV